MIKNIGSSAFLLLLICFFSQSAYAQSLESDSQEIQNRIKSVENNLRQWTK